MDIGEVPNWVITLGFAVFLTAAVLVAIDNFQDSNTTTIPINGTVFNITQEGMTGLQNTSDFYGTSGTMIGIGILISIVLGAFVYSKTRA